MACKRSGVRAPLAPPWALDGASRPVRVGGPACVESAPRSCRDYPFATVAECGGDVCGSRWTWSAGRHRPVTAEVRYECIDGSPRLRCAVVGFGPPVLIVHGLTDDADCWLGVASRLAAAGMRVVIPDLHGHGESEPGNAGYRIATFVADVLRTAETMLSEPAVVCGHSLGARVLLHVAATPRSFIRHAVYIDPPFRDRQPMALEESDPTRQRYDRFAWLRVLRDGGGDAAWSERRRLSPLWDDDQVSAWVRSKFRVSEAVWGPEGPEETTPNWRELLEAMLRANWLHWSQSVRTSR